METKEREAYRMRCKHYSDVATERVKQAQNESTNIFNYDELISEQ